MRRPGLRAEAQPCPPKRDRRDEPGDDEGRGYAAARAHCCTHTYGNPRMPRPCAVPSAMEPPAPSVEPLPCVPLPLVSGLSTGESAMRCAATCPTGSRAALKLIVAVIVAVCLDAAP